MSSMLTSQCLVIATTMAVSAGTLLLLDLLWQKYSIPTNTTIPQNQTPPNSCLSSGSTTIPRNQHSSPENQTPPKSCLSSGDTKQGVKMKKKVKFADDVKDSNGNGEEYRKEHKKVRIVQKSGCANEILDFPGLPPNRKALYDGMLKAKFQRMEFSF
ncbi:hypothetical protein Leryth_022031 [Lithospermum erythrorhizon]|nr:hypothetical protein Leryth_022031 [Lithospermum erythrorhizon]